MTKSVLTPTVSSLVEEYKALRQNLQRADLGDPSQPGRRKFRHVLASQILVNAIARAHLDGRPDEYALALTAMERMNHSDYGRADELLCDARDSVLLVEDTAFRSYLYFDLNWLLALSKYAMKSNAVEGLRLATIEQPSIPRQAVAYHMMRQRPGTGELSGSIMRAALTD